MALRLIEIILPLDAAASLHAILDEAGVPRPRHEVATGDHVVFRVTADADETGPLVDAIDERFSTQKDYQLLILPVEAALPRREGPEADAERKEAADAAAAEAAAIRPTPVTTLPAALGKGVSREELYSEVTDMSKLTRVFTATVVLSTIVAAIGLVRGNPTVIIGAMVIAPLLGPNLALAFASTLGDVSLARQALFSNLVGVGITVALAIAMGTLLTVDPTVPELSSRTIVRLSDIALALASGSVSALAMTTGVSTALVGVMVAVALMPPTVVAGLMLGGGEWRLAGQAGLLVATNIICVNLAGVMTFYLQGVRPRSWWEVERARTRARIAIGVWAVVLAVIVLLILRWAE